ncbi:MAG: QueT transporter family protein [Streptococcus sp.]
MNSLSFYNMGTMIAVTLGCMIANLFVFGWIDVLSVEVQPCLLRTWTHSIWSIQNKFLFDGLIRLDHFLFAIFFSISMFTIALELYYLQGQPFFYNWLTMDW